MKGQGYGELGKGGGGDTDQTPSSVWGDQGPLVGSRPVRPEVIATHSQALEAGPSVSLDVVFKVHGRGSLPPPLARLASWNI